MSAFDAIKAAPPDKVFHTMTLFRADNHPNKLNLGIGAYRTDQGEPYVLPIVRSTELQLADCSGTGIKSKNMKQIHSVERMADFVLEACSDKGLNKEYLPIRGMAEFVSRSQILILGENSKALAENRVAGCQTIAGTGALRVGAEFIHRNLSDRSLYCSDPTWANHHEIFRGSSISVGPPYRYQDASNRGLNFTGMLSDIGSKPMGSVILLHACAHNPTGVDPSNEQWKEICSVIKKRNHIAFFDCAYQGYATGDLDQDAFAVRLFEKEGVEMFIAQSFSKNMGLYGERIGCLSVISNTGNKNIIESQLAKICRSSYSNPPVHGAQIVSAILGNPINTKTWINELMQMSSRISHMRDLLFKYLTENNTPGK